MRDESVISESKGAYAANSEISLLQFLFPICNLGTGKNGFN